MYVIATVFCSIFHFSASLHVPFSPSSFQSDSSSNAYLLANFARRAASFRGQDADGDRHPRARVPVPLRHGAERPRRGGHGRGRNFCNLIAEEGFYTAENKPCKVSKRRRRRALASQCHVPDALACLRGGIAVILSSSAHAASHLISSSYPHIFSDDEY